MRVLFLIGSGEVGGGYRVIFEIANRLADRGHAVTLASGAGKPAWFDLRADFIRVPDFNDRSLPDSDVLIATANPTELSAAICSSGVGFYLVQHYETIFSDDPAYKAACDASYGLPLVPLVFSRWLEDLMREKFDRAPLYVPMGLNHDQFRPVTVERKPDTTGILFTYSAVPFKGAACAIEACRRLAERDPKLRIEAFGSSVPERDIPFPHKFHTNPAQEDLKRIYSAADIFISSSTSEGFGLPGLEAMACGAALVTTDSLGPREYAVDGETALVVPSGDSQALVEACQRLIDSPDLRKNLAEEGRRMALEFDWEKTIDRLEEVFELALADDIPPVNTNSDLQDRILDRFRQVRKIRPEDKLAVRALGPGYSIAENPLLAAVQAPIERLAEKIFLVGRYKLEEPERDVELEVSDYTASGGGSRPETGERLKEVGRNYVGGLRGHLGEICRDLFNYLNSRPRGRNLFIEDTPGYLTLVFHLLGHRVELLTSSAELADFARWRFAVRKVEIRVRDAGEAGGGDYDNVIVMRIGDDPGSTADLIATSGRLLKPGGGLYVRLTGQPPKGPAPVAANDLTESLLAAGLEPRALRAGRFILADKKSAPAAGPDRPNI